MYGDNVLGATDEAILLYMKTPQNKVVFDALKDETYPEYAIKTTKVENVVEEEITTKTKTKK